MREEIREVKESLDEINSRQHCLNHNQINNMALGNLRNNFDALQMTSSRPGLGSHDAVIDDKENPIPSGGISSYRNERSSTVPMIPSSYPGTNRGIPSNRSDLTRNSNLVGHTEPQ